MKSKRLAIAFVVAMLAALVACGKGPTTPTIKCTDPLATNNGGPLPCVYPPITESSVKMTFGPSNGTIASYGFTINVTLSYQVLGDTTGVFAWSCLSVDGVTFLSGGCSGTPVNGSSSGSVNISTGLPSTFKGQIADTHWILNYLVIGNPITGKVLAQEKLPLDIHYQ